MAFKPGHTKVPGSGMVKGQLTKKSAMLMEIFDAHDFCPAEAALKLILDPESDLLDKERADLFLKLMKFKFGEKKSVEHTGELVSDLFSRLVQDVHGSK